MRAFICAVCVLLGMSLLAGCGATSAALHGGQSSALAPDLTVRLLSTRPSWNQLKLQIFVLPTGSTALESLIPDVVVIPDGGKESSATLDLHSDQAVITMVLENAQNVASVTVRDARSGHFAHWDIGTMQALLPCKQGDDCGLLGVPHSPSLPAHP